MGARQLMMYVFYYTAEAPGRQWNCAVDINAYCRADADAKFTEHMHEMEPNHEGMNVTISSRVEVEAVRGEYTKIYEDSDELYTRYHIVRGTDRESRRRKKKWVVRRYTRGYCEVFYFSSREKAARWVVLDA